MADYKYVGKRIPRDDAVAKATGSMKFFADYKFRDCLHGWVCRSSHPHAKILNINIEKAMAYPGVVDVITWKDVPGHNGFGIVSDDQPVFCQDKVRFIGDTVAMVVAESEDIARAAAPLVEVEYEVLEPLTDRFYARKPEAPQVQKGSNVASHFEWKTGDVEQYFTDDYVVVENHYQTPYQEHVHLETEVAIARRTEDDELEIWAPSQYPYQDIRQLAVILDIAPQKIHCHNHPIGGGFGAKDDMCAQPLVAVAAWKLRRTVRLELDREDSFLYSVKRVPFTYYMKTAADKEGNLVAHKVETYGDVGPFSGIGVAVFNYGVENCCGAYYVPTLDVMGEAIFTNNAHTGAFRGFGNNQLNWGLEMQMDEIAAKLGMDRLELRAKNLIQSGKRLSYGHLHEGCDGLQESFKQAAKSWLWTHQEEFKKGAKRPWLKRGIGIASCHHGNGLGNAMTDEGRGTIQLNADGSFTVYLAMVDIGQGLTTTAHMMAAEALKVPYSQVHMVMGETDLSPDAGPTTASRSTYVAGNIICSAVQNFCKNLEEFLRIRYRSAKHAANGFICDSQLISWKDLYPGLRGDLYLATGECVVPITDLKIQIGLHKMHSHVTQITGVEVNTLTGKVDVLATEFLPAAGTVINRIGYEGQCEGGIVMMIGYALTEDYRFADGKPQTKNLQTYLVPTAQDIPDYINITPIENFERSGPFGAKGLGEPVTIPGAPAITNAIRDAVGITVHELPATPERVLNLLKEQRAAGAE